MEGERADDVKQITALIYAVFEAGKNKDLPALEGFHSRKSFTKFDEFPPYTRQDSEQALVHEEAAFANISDYEYKIEGLSTQIFGEVCTATFYLEYRGVFVNDYSFEGRPVGSRSRVTMVLRLEPEGWKIIHEHFSTFPEWPTKKSGP